MAMAERRNLLVDFVNSEGSVTFAQIKQQFPDVSDMTLRTDLKALDQQGEIIRVHGGAKSVGFAVGTDDLLSRRAGRRSAEKALIAKKAASLITPGHTIFIDSGSTTTALAAAMEDMDLLVFTSSLTVASVEEVRSMTFDQVFLGVTGHRRREGFSCGSDDEAVFKKTLVDRANECIVLMDSSKEDRPSTFLICKLRDVDSVISDGGLSADFVSTCEDQGVTVQ